MFRTPKATGASSNQMARSNNNNNNNNNDYNNNTAARPGTPPSPTNGSEKPLPDPGSSATPQRPGTSGTEAALKMTRRQASEKYRQAQRAERIYRAKKRSAIARANYADAKQNFRQARSHFALGCKLLVAAIRGWPYIVREKREARRVKAEEEMRRKVLEKKRRLDEKLGVVGEGANQEAGEEGR
ncbi:hypothetical protein MYCTH_2298770 [Thermothelomyces thermophilus ATCC 42464]|uniref:Uncharacterized protein n=1 Tax=Thermothelomyces thermophilus (strain ATCC 42464 / BCRC 31852 / DSM 1799) TaxID=573729 RepID=G2Q3D5_THET4|nr:uncharacterized protein MYCTH_2298770 [Thermothelomyces thermophilus ATCC 42464]AEO55195.1 hypothetical protein MYCTH_2298770 [Thermothelomyces thermophilus ATCC 42464]